MAQLCGIVSTILYTGARTFPLVLSVLSVADVPGSESHFPMQTLTFKTNINCGGCIKAVTPAFNGEKAIQTWQVDTANPDKILTVTTDLSTAQVQALVEEAGFKAQAA